ncbi:hypothetical protein [Pseudomonas sp. GXZC]|uniref:hypothetical protein n=1 Tax=Pseudomonas sp. GXZC TaxID=3003351 RepID=UPI0022AAB816|nr:hypothetical protein [Pseudomonas sp. GXZC]WAT32242.1 hypothetical protein OZ428_33745 [Pseudomonas sp. GXZC]
MANSKSLLLAYEATGEHREVVFAISTSQAREILSALICSSSDAPVECKRAPWADEYAQSGRIPLLAKVEHGIKAHCSLCAEVITDVAEVVIDGSDAFCRSACEAKFVSARAMEKAVLDEAAEIALVLWPEVVVMKVEMVEGRARVHFTFGSPARHAFWFVDEDQVQVSPVDEESWAHFNAKMRLSRPA